VLTVPDSGSGLNDTQKVVLNMMDTGTADGPGEATSQGVRKQLLALEKAINKNRDMRTKYGNDPSKCVHYLVSIWTRADDLRLRFVDSEFILLEALNALLLLASSPVLSYPILLELSTLNSLADLLSHENTEIAIAVIEVLEEMTDEEVLETEGEDEDEDTDERQEAMRILVEGIVEAGMVDLVISGLERLNEADEAERGGVYHTLGTFSSICVLAMY
jgi:beta-catenin-like protein 1